MSKHFCSVSLIGQIQRVSSFAQRDDGCALMVVTRRPERVGGEWIEVEDMHELRVYGNDIDYVVRFCKEGMIVAADGDLRYENIISVGDADCEVAFIVCNRITLLNPSPEAVEFKREHD